MKINEIFDFFFMHTLKVFMEEIYIIEHLIKYKRNIRFWLSRNNQVIKKYILKLNIMKNQV